MEHAFIRFRERKITLHLALYFCAVANTNTQEKRNIFCGEYFNKFEYKYVRPEKRERESERVRASEGDKDEQQCYDVLLAVRSTQNDMQNVCEQICV